MEKKFNEKFNNLLLNKNANAVFLNKVKYNELILKVNNVKLKPQKRLQMKRSNKIENRINFFKSIECC